MKSLKPKGFRKSEGFTIIELLVVIAIILVLSAVFFAVGTRMIRKSKATIMAANMKQISTFFNGYATDNQQQLLPCRGDVVQLDGSIDSEGLWHEIILSMVFETTDPAQFKDDDWWNGTESFLRNPLFDEDDTPRGWSALNPGFGYNIMLPENYETAESGTAPDAASVEYIKVPMAYLDEPSRIPIIAPADDYLYRYDESQIDDWESPTHRKFLTDDNFPVLFLDGHIENVKPGEYVSRKLHEMPIDTSP